MEQWTDDTLRWAGVKGTALGTLTCKAAGWGCGWARMLGRAPGGDREGGIKSTSDGIDVCPKPAPHPVTPPSCMHSSHCTTTLEGEQLSGRLLHICPSLPQPCSQAPPPRTFFLPARTPHASHSGVPQSQARTLRHRGKAVARLQQRKVSTRCSGTAVRKANARGLNCWLSHPPTTEGMPKHIQVKNTCPPCQVPFWPKPAISLYYLGLFSKMTLLWRASGPHLSPSLSLPCITSQF